MEKYGDALIRMGKTLNEDFDTNLKDVCKEMASLLALLLSILFDKERQ